MDRSRHPTLCREVRRCIDALVAALEELGRTTEVGSAETRTTFPGVIAAMQGQLQTLSDLVKHTLAETGSAAEAHDALTRLIEQARARRHHIQQELERTLATPAGDWEGRAAVLEAARRQLDKLVQVAVHELASRFQRHRRSDS